MTKKHLSKFASALLISALIISAFLLTACSIKRRPDSDLIFTLKEDGTYSVAAAEGFARDTLTVPTEHEGAAVTEIAASGFEGRTSLKTLIIPQSITVIGERAFASCTHLQDITIPFFGRTPDENEDTEHLGYLFGASSHTENADVIPTSLSKVTLTGGETVSEYAFKGCISLQTVTVPDSVKSIAKGAFSECKALKSVTIPFIGPSEAEMSDSFLGYLFGAESPFDHKDTVPQSLESVTLTKGEKLPARAFYECEFLSEINLPDTLKWIGAYAFQSCQYLEEIVIPKGVETIQADILKDCSYIKSLTVPFIGKKKSDTRSLLYFFDSDSITISEANIPGSLEKVTLTNSYFATGFRECRNIKDIVLCDGIAEITGNAFYGCTALRSIYIPSTVAKISAGAFSDLSCLEEVTIDGSALTSIKNGTFRNCFALKKITIPDSVTVIGQSAFENCYALTEINIPQSVTALESNAFHSCKSLTRVTGCEGLTLINQYAFEKCTALESIPLPNTLISINYGAFTECTSLKSITLPESLRKLGGKAFSGCSSLTEIVIPKGIKTVMHNTFENCTSIEKITLHAGIGTIYSEAFFNNTSLGDIYYEGTKEEWDKVKRGGSWMYGAPKPTLHCSDYVKEDFYENVSWVG